MTKINSAATKQSKILAQTILVSLFAAFICAGSFINIPLPGGVPLVLQDMFAVLAGILLGPFCGVLAVALFLFLGCVGLPVFSGKAGTHIIIAGPTGGFLVGYLFGALAGGIIMDIAVRFSFTKKIAVSRLFAFLATLMAMVVVFIFGLGGFMRVAKCDLAKAVAVCLVPFVPGTFLKLAASVPLVVRFRQIIENYRH